MRYGSVCSGIEAASVAWHPLGWKPAFFSEIEKFPAAVLDRHYPGVPNFGDLTQHRKWTHEPIDLLVGGTPCQSFSVAGLRAGLDDPRGNLALEFLALTERARPRWVVWENVPGVLSSNAGRDFGSIIGALGKLGYGFSYRVLDAQFIRVDEYARAVPQRRRRVILIGYLGDWRRAAAVLFERESLSGHSAPRRQTRESVAPTISARPTGGGGLGTDFDLDGGLIHCAETASTLNAHFGDKMGLENQHINEGGSLFVAHTLRAAHDAGEDGSGRGTPLVPIAFDCKGTEVQFSEDGSHPTLRSMGHNNSHQNAGGHAAISLASAVRRLTPRECERLQGFPDDYTQVPWRKKIAENCPDGPRYKALGNSMAVNVMRWVGRRIDMVENIEVPA